MVSSFSPIVCIPTDCMLTLLYITPKSEGSKGITHYLGDKNRFDVSSEGPSSGISVGGGGGGVGESTRVFI